MLSKPDVESSDGRYVDAIDVEVEQIADDVRVLGAIQPMQSGRRRERLRGAIELVLERRDHRVEVRRIRALHAERRHLSRAHLAHDQFPLLAIRVHVRRVEAVHGQPTR